MLCVPQLWDVPLQDTIRTRVVLSRDPMIRHVANVRVANVRVASVRAHTRHRDKRCRRATASPRVNQARLSATATNDAPSTMVVVATTIATTRVQAKILDCSNVTRLTTRAKRRVRINKTPSTAHDTNCRNLPARCCSTVRDPITHRCQKKDSDSPNERLTWRIDAKRSHLARSIIHLMESGR